MFYIVDQQCVFILHANLEKVYEKIEIILNEPKKKEVNKFPGLCLLIKITLVFGMGMFVCSLTSAYHTAVLFVGIFYKKLTFHVSFVVNKERTLKCIQMGTGLLILPLLFATNTDPFYIKIDNILNQPIKRI